MGQSVFLVRVFFSCLSSAQQWEHWVFGFFFFWVHFFVLFCVVFLPSQGRCTFPPLDSQLLASPHWGLATPFLSRGFLPLGVLFWLLFLISVLL